MTVRKTLTRPVLIEGFNPEMNLKRLLDKESLKKGTSVLIEPAEIGQGIIFYNREFSKTPIPLNIKHAYSKKTFLGPEITLSSKEDTALKDRFRSAKNIYINNTVGLLSAFHHLGITDASVYVSNSKFNPREAFIPYSSKGISLYVNQLKDFVKTTDKKISPVTLSKEVEVKFTEAFEDHLLHLKPRINLAMHIYNKSLNSSGISFRPIFSFDTYRDMNNFLDARPLIDESSFLLKHARYFLEKEGFVNLSENNNIIINSETNAIDLMINMGRPFSKERNEHLANNLLRRFGELYAVAGRPFNGYVSVSYCKKPIIKELKKLVRDNTILIPAYDQQEVFK